MRLERVHHFRGRRTGPNLRREERRAGPRHLGSDVRVPRQPAVGRCDALMDFPTCTFRGYIHTECKSKFLLAVIFVFFREAWREAAQVDNTVSRPFVVVVP